MIIYRIQIPLLKGSQDFYFDNLPNQTQILAVINEIEDTQLKEYLLEYISLAYVTEIMLHHVSTSNPDETVNTYIDKLDNYIKEF
jgi:hypothetical protein